MRIHACFNIYNEAEFIEEAIKSVLWADQVIVVDGIFQGFPSRSINSDDNTIQIVQWLAKKHPKIKLIMMSKPSLGPEKIEAYRNLVPYGDYILRLNGDEILGGKVDKIYSYIKSTNYLPLYSIREIIDLGTRVKPGPWQPRLIKNTPDLKITSKHLVLTNNFSGYKVGPRNRLTPEEANIDFLYFIHKKELRNSCRKQQNKQWLNYYLSLIHI